jgi:hypothetical protein
LKKLEKHLCVSHLGFDLEQQKKPHSCVDCDKKQTPQSVWPHFIAAHTDFKFKPKSYRATTSLDTDAVAEATKQNDTKKPETVKPTSKTKSNKKLYSCPKCDLHDVNPLSLKKLEKHLCVSHLGFDLDQQKKPHSCVDCDKELTPQSVWPHFIAAHTDFKLQPSLFVKA